MYISPVSHALFNSDEDRKRLQASLAAYNKTGKQAEINTKFSNRIGIETYFHPCFRGSYHG